MWPTYVGQLSSQRPPLSILRGRHQAPSNTLRSTQALPPPSFPPCHPPRNRRSTQAPCPISPLWPLTSPPPSCRDKVVQACASRRSRGAATAVVVAVAVTLRWQRDTCQGTPHKIFFRVGLPRGLKTVENGSKRSRTARPAGPGWTPYSLFPLPNSAFRPRGVFRHCGSIPLYVLFIRLGPCWTCRDISNNRHCGSGKGSKRGAPTLAAAAVVRARGDTADGNDHHHRHQGDDVVEKRLPGKKQQQQ